MDFLGTVSEITSDGRVVVQTTTPPDMGGPVFDARNRRIGKIVRIFGPVDRPFVSVRVDDRFISLAGAELYTQKVKNNGKNKRRH